MKSPFPRAAWALFLAPLLFAVPAAWWQRRRPAHPATWAATAPAAPKNLIAVPIDPQLSGDGRLIAVGIQLLERFNVINQGGNKDYVDQVVGAEVRFWNARTLAPLPSLPLSSTPFWMTLSPDGSLLALGESGIGFRVVDLATRKTLWSQSEAESVHSQPEEVGMVTVTPPHGLSYPVFSPNGRTLAAWDVFIDSEEGTQQVSGFLLDARSGRVKASWKGASGSRLNDPTLVFSPDGRFLVSNELEPLIYRRNVPHARPEIRRASDGKLLRTLPLSGTRVPAFGSGNRLAVITSNDREGSDVLELDATTGRQLWSHTGTATYGRGQTTHIDSAFYSMDGKKIALCFRYSYSVEILDAQNGELAQVVQVPSAPSGPYTADGAFAFSPDGEALLAMSQGTIAKLEIN